MRIRLHSETLPYGEFLTTKDDQKGTLPGVLNPGLYPINPFVERVELHDPLPLECRSDWSRTSPRSGRALNSRLEGRSPPSYHDSNCCRLELRRAEQVGQIVFHPRLSESPP